MDPRMIGLVGGVAGGVIGIMGGIVGTYFSLKNTAGPRERTFMIRASVLAWVVVISFLAGLWLAPPAYRPLLWLPYILTLMPGIHILNRRQEQIRREEAAPPPDVG
jgi:hypothetical protein